MYMETSQSKQVDSLEKKLDLFYETLQKEGHLGFLKNSTRVIFFLSIGCPKRRADVFQASETLPLKAWRLVKRQALQHYKESQYDWLKLDIVESEESHSVNDFVKVITETKKNYFRKGISFDKQYRFAFLEQEINGNAIVQIDKQTGRGFIQEKNLKEYAKSHRPLMPKLDLSRIDKIRTFTTRGFFFEKNRLFPVHNTNLDNGRRKTPLTIDEVDHLIRESATFLANQVKDTGAFVYGYFSCFDKKIQFYNVLRHASTLYSMLEAYALYPDEVLEKAIKRGLHYLVNHCTRSYTIQSVNVAYIIDGVGENKEIKLGANAAAILALTKFQEVFKQSQYVEITQLLGEGILQMQKPDGSFNHVLYPENLQVKENFRIIYYDGEAAFALMRLYEQDPQSKWIDAVEFAFQYFIEKKYWKHHDHWLSYCTNELTKYRPRKEYFEFGLKNVLKKLNFIKKRETTYPTFLELTLAGWNMVSRLREHGWEELLTHKEIQRLEETFHVRAEYQRNGFFYPEVAMYFKKPSRILGSFYIRHHSFRSRIDDTEHYLSGYVAYYKLLKNRSAYRERGVS